MRLLLYADPHWSVTSSIVRSRGDKYSTRLENLITSLQWVEDLATKLECGAVVCLGDFFDTPNMNSEEISALGEISWALCPHYYIAGNHEMGRGDSSFSSAKVFDLCPQSYAITVPTSLPIYDQRDTKIICLPYILEKDRKPLKEYLENIKENLNVENIIILSHNDIKDVQMGSFLSTTGFTLDEIKENCNLFVNGHLHNGGVVAPGVVNLGNLTGQNFSEDGDLYQHNVMFIDTQTHEVEWIENPHAFKFYKLDFTTYDESDDEAIQQALQGLRGPAIITVKIKPENELFIKDLISTMDNIIESRVIIDMSGTDRSEELSEIKVSTDHIAKFVSFIENNLGKSDLISEELMKIGGDSA